MKKLTIEKMYRIAQDRGGVCLSTRYFNRHTKLKWQCAKGHKWTATPLRVKHKTWCPKCAIESRTEKLRLTIEDVKKIAIERNGKCLSKLYINSKTPIKWECKYGHRWDATLDSVKNGGHWCPVCAGNKKQTIVDMQELAQQKGGTCLSTIYCNMNTKLLWQCAKDHKWEANPNNIKHGTWCPICAKENRKQIFR